MTSSILTPGQVSLSDPSDKNAPFCGICRRQFSRYTCPRCNLLYCSLSCFRAEAHSQCSESFYRDQLATDIHAEPSTSATERKAMMDLLKRFEEDSLDDPFATNTNGEDDDDEGAGDDDLERRFAGIDLGSASVDRIWAALTPEERTRFTSAVRDPTSELAKTLLSSSDIADDIPTPWWEASSSIPGEHTPTRLTSRAVRPPDVMTIPEALLTATPPPSSVPAFPLAYNLVAILVAYAYASRHLSAYPLSSSPDARALISRLVPFLVARDDKTRFPGIESASTDIYSRFATGTITPAAFALLLCDAATLLRPPPLISEDKDDEKSVPVPGALRALSDLHALFDSNNPRDPRVAAKVVFYAAQVRCASAQVLRAIGADAERWAARLDEEEEEGGQGGQGTGPGSDERRAVGSEATVVGTTRELGEIRRLAPESLNVQGRETSISIVELS